MRKIIFNVLFVISAVFSDSKSLVAVLDFNGNGISGDEAKTISDNLSSELSTLNSFRILERGQISSILSEQGFQESGACDESSCQLEMGKLLGVEKLIIGSVGKVGKTYTITGRVVSIKSGEVELSAKEFYTGEIDGLLITSAPRLAKKLSGVEVDDLSLDVGASSKESQMNSANGNSKTWIRILGGVALVGGSYGIWHFQNEIFEQNKLAKAANKISAQERYIGNAEEAQTGRDLSAVFAAVGAVGIGLTFAF